MRDGYSDALGNLVDQLAKLPGIGRKSAQRLAFHILKQPDKEARLLADAIVEAKEKIRYCKLCYNLTDQELCPICSNPDRDSSTICVVEDARDVHGTGTGQSVPWAVTMCCTAPFLLWMASARNS